MAISTVIKPFISTLCIHIYNIIQYKFLIQINKIKLVIFVYFIWDS